MALERRQEAERLQGVSLAMAENRMLLYAQRIARVGDPSYLHHEVLVRMRGTDGSLHLPGQFMPAVERYGMAVALDRHVLGLLFRHLQVPGARAPAGPVQRQRPRSRSPNRDSSPSSAQPARAQPHAGLQLCFEITGDCGDQQPQPGPRLHRCGEGTGCRMALDDSAPACLPSATCASCRRTS